MTLFLLGAAAIASVMLVLWLVSVRRRDASIVDIFWGPGFAVLAWVWILAADHLSARALILTWLVTLWGGRLGLHIGTRARGKGEDYRYAAMRESWGPRFWWVSLFQVFGLQAVLMLLIATPLLMANLNAAVPLGWIDAVGIGVFLIGFAFEAVGDWQLARFKASPESRGKTMQSGLWRYTRHPNYFGDALLWWGLFIVGGVGSGALWTVVAPVVMTFLLMRVSGVPMLEKRMAKVRPDFADYAARTNAFFPWFPRKSADRQVTAGHVGA